MKRTPRILTCLWTLTALVLLAACGGQPAAPTQAPAQAPAPATQGAPAPAAEPTADQGGGQAAAVDSLAALVAAAKQEGSVTIYAGGHTRDQITELVKRFEEQYGIKVNATRKPTGEIMQMLAAEKQAGKVGADVISAADLAALDWLRQQGMLVKYQPPNAADIAPALMEPTGDSVPFTLNVLGIAYNTAKVPADKVPQKWQDLMDPVFAGQVAHGNPATSGTTAGFVNAVSNIAGWDVYRVLGAGGMLVQDSATALAQFVITGEALVALPGVEPQVIDAQKKGEPLAMAYPAEGVPMNAYYVAVVEGAAHPNAAKLFMAFHVAEDTQRFLNDELAARSVLKHVPPPAGLPALGDLKLVNPDFAWMQQNRDQMLEQFNGYLKK